MLVKNEKYKEALKSIFWGIALIVGAVLFWLYLAGNPFHELALILNSNTTSGFIVNTWEDAEDGEEGGTHWYHYIGYKFEIENGSTFQSTMHGSGRLKDELHNLSEPFPIEVEYLVDNPNINRIKGDGCQSISEWLWRKVGLGGLLLILFLSPGFILLRDGAKLTIKLYNDHSKELLKKLLKKK